MGAGIGGLAAAHHLKLLSEQRDLPLEIVVLEASERAGGLVGTERYAGALLERGPDTLVTHKPAGIALCRNLGLGDRLVHPQPGRTDILLDGRLRPLPAGFALLAPTRRWPLLTSPILGRRGRLRALAEPLLPRAKPTASSDESVAAFVRRRFGAELLERIAEPIVGGIYMADVEQLSLAATLPRFLALEREHGSVIRGLRSAAAARSNAGRESKPGLDTPGVVALTGGLGQLVAALVDRLPPGSLRLGSKVESLIRDESGFELRFAGPRLAPLRATAVLVATPGPSAASVLRSLDPALAESLRAIDYASCVTLNLGWPRRAVERPPRGHGFFVPRSAGLALVAAGFVDVKFPERVPADQIVVRLFLGGALRPEAATGSDAGLIEVAARVLAPLLGLREPPAWSRVFRHPQSMPQLAVGHLERATRLRAAASAHPGFDLAGGPVGAYGLPDSIAAAESAAERLFEWIALRVETGPAVESSCAV